MKQHKETKNLWGLKYFHPDDNYVSAIVILRKVVIELASPERGEEAMNAVRESRSPVWNGE